MILINSVQFNRLSYHVWLRHRLFAFCIYTFKCFIFGFVTREQRRRKHFSILIVLYDCEKSNR